MTSHPSTSDDGGARRKHELKTWPSFFAALLSGAKTFEVRENDRDFAVGDTIELAEYEPNANNGFFTMRALRGTITYVMPGGRFGIDPKYCVLGLSKLEIADD